jgi:hypothetical protein
MAIAIGPPAPILHSQGHSLVAAHGGFCWSEPTDDGGSMGICGDPAFGPVVTKRSLVVVRHGRIRVEMRTKTDSLYASLHGRAGSLRVTRRSPRRFIVRLPRHMKRHAVLDLDATYPQGDSAFGARLRVR